MTDHTVVPISYLLRESQYDLAGHIQRWFTSLVNAPGSFPPSGIVRGIQSYTDPDDPNNVPWSVDRQLFSVREGRWLQIEFEHHGFTAADGGGWVYGPPSVVSAGLETLPDHTYLFDARQRETEPLDVDLEETVTYEHHRETTTSRTIHFDFGAKLGATIGGKESGGSIEAEVSAAFGFSDTDTSVAGESTSETRTQRIRTKVPAGEALLATLSSPTVASRTEFTINAAWLAGMKLRFWSGYNDWGYVKQMVKNQGRTRTGIPIPESDDQLTEISFTDMDDFVEMLQATNVYFPEVASLPAPYLDFAGLSDAVEGRRIVASGVENSTVQHASDYRFETVSDISKALAGLPDGHYITA